MDRPIIERATDTDLYKFTVSQFADRYHPDVEVEFALTNRTKDVRLADIVDIGRLREELEAARRPEWTERDERFMRTHELAPGVRTFTDGFVDYQLGLTLPEYHVEIRDGQFDVRQRGPWPAVTMGETRGLSILNELYYQALEARGEQSWDDVAREGWKRINEKAHVLREGFDRHSPIVTCPIVEFGTRRRYSRGWQRNAYLQLRTLLPTLIAGTSNVAMAADHNHLAIGTYPHECDMAYQGIYGIGDNEGLLRSHEFMLDDWYDLYGRPLAVLLSDTYGTHHALRTFGRERAERWRGLRHDSGDPFAFGERVIAYYESLGIDPKSKCIVFSDGLSAQKIVDLNERFGRRIQCLYGWGTKWSNDLGLRTLSIVMKLVKSNGCDTFKLSDNFAKTQGTPEVVDRGKRVFGYRDEDYGYTPCEV